MELHETAQLNDRIHTFFCTVFVNPFVKHGHKIELVARFSKHWKKVRERLVSVCLEN